MTKAKDAHDTGKRILAMLLCLVLCLSLVPSAAFAVGGVTNQSLSDTLDAMTASGDIPSNPNNVYFLDLSGKTEVLGDIDIAELAAAYPNLSLVTLDGTNIREVTNPISGITATYSNTFKSGKTISSGGTPVTYLESAGDLQVSALLAAAKMTDANGLVSAIPAGLLAQNGTAEINGTVYPVSANGTISAAVMAAIPAGTYTVQMVFPFRESVSIASFSVTLKVQRAAYTLTSAENPTHVRETLYKGGTIDLKLTKTDETGAAGSLGALADYDFTYSASGVTLTPVMNGAGTAITITASAASNGQSGYVSVEYNGVRVAEYELVVASNPAVSSITLVECNDGVLSDTVAPNTVGKITIAGGTAISSLTPDNVIQANRYTKSTIYLLKDQNGNFLPERYKGQITLTVDPAFSALNASLISTADPNGGEDEVLALSISSGYSNYQDCSTSTGAVLLRLSNDGGSTPTTAALNVESIAAKQALGYEIYSIPGSTTGGLYDFYSKAQMEAEIQNGGFPLAARYEKSGATYEKVPGIGQDVVIVEGDSVYLVAVAYYEEGGDRFVLAKNSISGWYDSSVLASNLFGSSSRPIGSTNLEGHITPVPLSDYSKVLELKANMGSTEETGEVIMTVEGAAANVAVGVRVIAPVITKYIFAPAGYTPLFGTYKADLDAEISDFETTGTVGALYQLNVRKETELAIGDTAEFKVIGVYSNNSGRETVLADWAGAPAASIATASNASVADVEAGATDEHIKAVATSQGGVGDSKAGSFSVLTVADDNGVQAKLTVRLAASQITGVYMVLEDLYGNFYSKDAALYAYPDVAQLTAAFQIPLGSTAKAYAVYRFSNDAFYDVSVSGGWMDCLADPANVIETHDTVPTTYFTTAMGADHFVLQGITQIGDADFYLRLNNAVTSAVVGGVTHGFSAGAYTNTQRYGIQIAAPMIVAAEADRLTSGAAAPIPNGGTETGSVGNTISLSVNVRYGDGTTAAASSASPISGLGLNVVCGDDSSASAYVDVDNYGLLLKQVTTGLKVCVAYTRTINGVEETTILPDFAPSPSTYLFTVDINEPTVDRLYLVATGSSSLKDLTGGQYALTYAFSEKYRIYPVAADSSYSLCGYAALPGSISYGDVAAKDCFRFLKASDFDTTSAWTLSGISGLAVGTLSTDENGYVYYDMSAVGVQDGTVPYTVTINPGSVTMAANSVYSAFLATAAADVDVFHRMDATNINVVDIVPVMTNGTGANADEISLGGTAEFSIQYAVSSTPSGASSILVNPSYFGSDNLPGSASYDAAANNALRVEELSIPAGAEYTLGSAGNTLTIQPTQPGVYQFKVYTINNAGVRAPYNDPKYQLVAFQVNASVAAAETARWNQPAALAALSGISGVASVTEAAGNSYLDAAALNSGVLKLADNIPGTASTTVELKNSSGSTMVTVPVTLVGATMTAANLNRTTAAASLAVFAPGQTDTLFWLVSYTYNDASGSFTQPENIDPASWTLIQNASDQVLALSGDSVTAGGTAAGMMVYEATYPGASPAMFWAKLDVAAVAPAHTYGFSSSGGAYSPISAVTLTVGAPNCTLYVWDTAAGTLVSGLAAAVSSNDTVSTLIGTAASAVTFSANAAGSASITVYPAEGGSISIPVTVNSSAAASYAVTGTVLDALSAAIPGAAVSITNGSGTYTATTDASGAFTVTGVPNGSYTYTVSAPGFDTGTGTVTVSGANTPLGTIVLTAAVSVGHTVSGSINVNGAAITLTDGATSFSAVSASGSYSIPGVPDGTYSLAASATGYAAYTGTVTVSGADVTRNVTLSASGGGGGGGGGGGTASSTYTVTVKSPENGTLQADKTSAEKGATVTVTVSPSSGYQLSSVSAVTAGGASVSLTKKDSETYTFSMPAANVTVSAAFAATFPTPPSEDYTDLDPDAWYREYVDYVIEHGYMNGISASAFSPNGLVSRAQMVQILYNMEGQPAVTADDAYADVAAGAWYADAVAWGTSNGIVNGYGNGSFGPEDSITREQMAAILYRYASHKGTDVSARGDLSGFADCGDVGSYALDAMQWTVAAGIISGTSGTTLSPKATALRTEVAAIITRYCNMK